MERWSERKRRTGRKGWAPGLIRRREGNEKGLNCVFGEKTERREGTERGGYVKMNLPRDSNLIGVGSVQDK